MKCVKCGVELPDEAVYCFMCGKKQITQKKASGKKTRGNGTGSVYKIGNKWACEVTIGYRQDDDGKKRKIIKRKKGFKTKAEALEYLPTLKSTPQKAENITLESLWTFFRENYLPELSKSKQGHYLTAYKKIKEIMFVDISLIDIKMLQDLVNKKAPTFYPAKDIKTLLSQLYDLAVAQQYVTVNIAKYIKLPKLDEEAPNPFTEEEVKALWKDYLNGNFATGYALIMIYTGMMPGELFDLKTNMIDLEKRVIVGVGKKTKKRKETPIVLASCIVPVIEELLERANGEKFLPMHRDTYRQEFKEMLKRCGCRPNLVPYSCRHTTATSLALENISMSVIGEVMRHTKITTTQRYVHIDTSASLNAVDKMKQ